MHYGNPPGAYQNNPFQPPQFNGNPSNVANQMTNMSLHGPPQQQQQPQPQQQQQPQPQQQQYSGHFPSSAMSPQLGSLPGAAAPKPPQQQTNSAFPPNVNNNMKPGGNFPLPPSANLGPQQNNAALPNPQYPSNGIQNYPNAASPTMQQNNNNVNSQLPRPPSTNTGQLPPQQLSHQQLPPQQASHPTSPPTSMSAQSNHPPLPQQQNQHSLPQQQQNQPSVPQQQQNQPSVPQQQQNQPSLQQQQNLPPLPQQNRPPSAQYPGIPVPASNGLNGQSQLQQQQQRPMGSMPPLPGSQYPPQNFPGQTSQPNMPPMPGQNLPPVPQNQFNPQMPLPGQRPTAYNMPPQQPMQQFQQGPPRPGQFPPQPNQQPYGQQPYQQQPGAFGQQPGMQYPPGMAAAPPQRRLDPDQMPNPIQVMSENQLATTGPFVTSEPGAVPPLVTTKFVTHDQGNSGPRYIRSTMYNVPATPEMMKQVSVPFSLVVSPFAKPAEGEMVPPIVDFGELGPIRCIRCKAYMSPNMQFVDAGRRFRCLLCKATTDVPAEYFQHLDHAGQRADKYERPELVLGTYEFVATKEYCRENKPSKPPAFIFIIDVSYNNIKSGLVHLLCKKMKEILKNLPIDQGQDRSKMKVGFITYNNTVHFYNVKENLAQPQMMVVGDVHEMFMPLLDGFFCDANESGVVIDALMEQIPIMFGDTRETETILLPAIQAGLEAIKASECSGKLLVFHSSLPVSDAPGRLQNREDRKLLGTEKEKAILTPQNNSYNNLGQDCVLAGCSVDLFIFNNSYIDLATIGQVSRLTGGEIYKYTYFQVDIDGPRVISDVIKNISRPIAFDAVMRVRTSAGIRPTEFYGHFFMSNTTDMDMACVTSDKAVGIEIKHDDRLPPEDNVYIQVALLFTACSGQRRIRILNLALKTCVQMADLFRCCDLDTVVLYFAKQIMFKLMDSTPRQIKDGLEARCAQILACYRKNCASPTSAGQLILPECMKLLPLYVSCLLKNDALSGGSDMSCDDRSYVMQFVLSMDLSMSVFYFYPRLLPIHDVDPNDDDIPAPIRCTIEKMLDDGAYILENGIHMFIWLGLNVAPEFTQAVFGAQCAQLVDTDRPGIPILDNPLSKRINGIINKIQAERPRCMRVTVIRQRDKLENVLRHFLIEDRSGTGAASYVDYLCHLHKEIRAILS